MRLNLSINGKMRSYAANKSGTLLVVVPYGAVPNTLFARSQSVDLSVDANKEEKGAASSIVNAKRGGNKRMQQIKPITEKVGRIEEKSRGEEVTKEGLENESAIIYLPNNLVAIRLPFITGDPAERLVVVRWYTAEGDTVVAGQHIVRIATMYQGIEMPMPPWLEGKYRIHRIEKQPGEIMVAGDVFVTLEDLNTSETQSEDERAA